MRPFTSPITALRMVQLFGVSVVPRKKAPKTPEEIMAEKLAAKAKAEAKAKATKLKQRRDALQAVNLDPDMAILASQENIGAVRKGETRGHQKVDDNVAWRADVFEALRDKMTKGAYDAARRLETDILKSRGEHDRGRATGRVDCDVGKDRLDEMADATRRVKAALSGVGKRDQWILTELICPTIPCGQVGGSLKLLPKRKDGVVRELRGWRAIVAYITGEEHDHAQAAVVRSACANLAHAYDPKGQIAA